MSAADEARAEALHQCEYCEISKSRCDEVKKLGYVKCCPDCKHDELTPGGNA